MADPIDSLPTQPIPSSPLLDPGHELKEEALLGVPVTPPPVPDPPSPPQPASPPTPAAIPRLDETLTPTPVPDIMSAILDADTPTQPMDAPLAQPPLKPELADAPPPPPPVQSRKKTKIPPLPVLLAVVFLIAVTSLSVIFINQQKQIADSRTRAASEKPESTALPTATPKPETNRQKSQPELRFDVYSDTYVKKGKNRPEPVMMWNINDKTSGFSGVAYFAYDKGLNQSLLFSRFTGVVPPSGNEVYTVWIKKGSTYEKRGFVDFITINGQPVGFSNFALPSDVISKSDQLVISRDSSFKPTTPENILFTVKGEKIK